MQTEVLDVLGFMFVRGLVSDVELRMLRGLIASQYYQRIIEFAPQRLADYSDAGMTEYHKVPTLDHVRMWPKAERTLTPIMAQQTQEMPFFRRLSKLFNVTSVSDEESFGHPEFYWRLVRPNQATDIGPLHADRWFWDLMPDFVRKREIPEGSRRIKVWLPIYAEPGRNGLLVLESSHLESWLYDVVEREGVRKPSLIGEPEMKLLPAAPGDAVIFHDELIHGGALNAGERTRVSLEFTLVCRR